MTLLNTKAEAICENCVYHAECFGDKKIFDYCPFDGQKAGDTFGGSK